MDLKTEKQLRQVFKQFSKDAFFSKVVATLSDWVSKNDVTSRIQRMRFQTSQKSIIDVFIDLLKKSTITNEDLQEKLPILMLFGVAHNAQRKTWTAYTLNGNGDSFKPEEDIETDIKHFCLENKFNANVTVKFEESVMWVQIIPKKLLKKRLVVYAPVYVAHFPGEPYLFLSKREASEIMLKSLSEGLGYNGFKYSNLSGHDLQSMVKHLQHKGVRRGHTETHTFNDHRDTSNGKDYSQHENRRKYITDLMGPDPPKLSNYVVVAKNLPWNGKMNFAAMNNTKFDMKIEFRTNDTVEMLKDMAECGVLKIPPPSYVKNLMSTGRNNIKLKVPGGPGATATDTEAQTDA